MKKLLTITAASLLLSSAAFASDVIMDNTAHFTTDSYQTKTEAFNAGFDITDNLTSITQTELLKKLPHFGDELVHDIAIDDTNVTIEEYATSRDHISFRAIVNVDYHYSAYQDDE